jgi:hypothetical protein
VLTCYETSFWEDGNAGDDGCVAFDSFVVERQLYNALDLQKDGEKVEGLRT